MAMQPGTAFVTGATSGIGEIYADRLARRGYDLVLVGRNAEKLAAMARHLTATYRVKVDPLVADLGESLDLARVEQRLADDNAITLLVNSAGLSGAGPLSEANLAALDRLVAVNVSAVTALAAVAAKAFSARGRGAIINLASAMAFFDIPRVAAYAASKAYVLSLSLALDLDVRPRGVRVQVVLPGYVRTAMIAGLADIPDTSIMPPDEMVDAALAGFDAGELVTIPSLERAEAFDAWLEARAAMRPFTSLTHPATRYSLAQGIATN